MAGLLQTSLVWVAYAVAVGLCLLAAIITTFTWQTPRDRSAIVSIVAILSITSLLATVLLLPVDIALVSSTTNSLGVKKDWATPSHVNGILSTLTAVYYSLYSFDALLCLVIIPFSYFWYEEYDEVEEEMGQKTVWDKLWGAFKYTTMFIIFVVILFIIGFFVPSAGNQKGKHVDLDYFKKLLAEGRGERALTFGVGLLMVLGTLLYLLYTGSGMALMPIRIIKSAPSISAPKLQETTASALEQNRERQHMLDMRNSGEERMSSKDRRELDALQREERTLVRRERLAAEASGEGHGAIYRAWTKIRAVFRPVELLGGIILFLIAILIWVSMLITGIDKAKNSICKAHCGYILGHIHVFQPMNWIFMKTAKVFPVDYVLMVLLVLFFFSASISGIASVGIRFLWVRIFQIKRGRTAPQALLLATVMLALVIFAINYTISMMVAPQYATYGTQVFCSANPSSPGAQPNCTNHHDLIKPCSEGLESGMAKDICTPSVMSTFLNRVTLNWPVFGAVAFWAQFGFLLVYLIVFVTGLIRTPKLALNDLDEEAEADEEESLLATTGRRYGAAVENVIGRPRNRERSRSDDASREA
ncbi:uncharacterized protein MKZ38_008235 [Zalerion maritima]|uniref:Probable lysosomal cobalamin transporter n=1 Tax=Zalerion maritima TaxID=339359 RepID=A0AAD5WNR6_9PEZI|nr:uncharacterized protein MKZ38_008235 [Zalerion maritima]